MSSQKITPHDKLMQAIGIMQAVYLSRSSDMDGEALFGVMFMPQTAMVQAINLCCEVLPDLEYFDEKNGT